MGHPAEDKKHFTVEEYLQYEEESEFRNEFYKGELFPVEATTRRHNNIAQNIGTGFRKHFTKESCFVGFGKMLIEVEKDIYYTYPDVSLTCDSEDNDERLIQKPSIIVEIYSPKMVCDKVLKWLRYRKIPSLNFYLTISQNDMMVEIYSRRKNNISTWSFQYFTDIQDIIYFESLDFELPLASIYEFVAFDAV